MFDSSETEPNPQGLAGDSSGSMQADASLNDSPLEQSVPVETDSSLGVDEGFFSLDPKSVKVDLISGLIFSGVVSVAALIGLAILWANLGFGVIWYSILAAVVVALAVLYYFAICWPQKSFNYASWRLDAEGLEIRRGVIFRHRICIPLGRVQHADVSQGPLQRPFGLGTLTVHTAGTSNASVNLEGLAHVDALALRDRLVRQRKAGDVV